MKRKETTNQEILIAQFLQHKISLPETQHNIPYGKRTIKILWVVQQSPTNISKMLKLYILSGYLSSYKFEVNNSKLSNLLG